LSGFRFSSRANRDKPPPFVNKINAYSSSDQRERICSMQSAMSSDSIAFSSDPPLEAQPHGEMWRSTAIERNTTSSGLYNSSAFRTHFETSLFSEY
jgi:hypothetical protein